MGQINYEANHSRDHCRLSELLHFADLPTETLNELKRIGRLIRFRSGQIVAHSGEAPEFIGCVRQGVLRMQKTLDDGRQHIVGLLVEGDMFGRVFDGPLNVSIEATADSEICAFQRAPFEALLLRSPELDRLLLLNVLNELDRARDWMIILANPRVKGRLSAFLLVLCARFAGVDHLLQVENGSLLVKIPIGRADLANLLGIRPESISRGFHALADSGSISIIRPNLIEILDLPALRVEAGEDDLGNHPSLKHLLEDLRKRPD